MADEHVRVQCFGICTHIKPPAIAPRFAGWGHRVVLVNASDPARFAGHEKLDGIEAHVATLQILTTAMPGEVPDLPWFRLNPENDPCVSPFVYEWLLEGVFLKFANGVDTDDAAEEAENCMPRVQDYVANDLVLTTSSPRGYLADPDLTSCFVDLPRQRLVGRTLGEASVGVFHVRTDGPPVITVIGFGGELVSFPVNPGAQISICNLPVNFSKDKDADFYLHMLLVPGSFPKTAGIPPKTCFKELVTANGPLHTSQITTAACSNSNYP